MNGPSYMDVSQGHIPQTIQSSAAPPGLAHYNYQTSQPLQGGPHPYGSSPTTYTPYGYPNGLAPLHQGGHSLGPLGPPSHPSLPTMANNMPAGSAGGQQYTFDTTGQIAPPGMKPRVTATLWEDEGSLCFQVEAGGICVARREDNHMINGTKLLNVAGMTRGRRDGILKSEKMRVVVKIGPMHLKGVWIPFERALEFANKEQITEQLYPLFVNNIGALLYHPQNPGRSSVGGATQIAAGDRRRTDGHQDYLRTPQSTQNPLPLHSVAVQSGAHLPQPPHSIAPHPGAGITSRSVPQTPATTPPGTSVSHMPAYQTTQPYDAARQMYSAPPQHGGFASMTRYGQIQASPYIKSEMAPPARAGAEDPNADHKPHDGYPAHSQADNSESEHEGDYTHSAGPYNANRLSYGYGGHSTQSSMHGDQQHMSSDLTGSPHHKPSGGATPRTTSYSAYNTPQRSQLPSSNLYDVMSDNRNATNGADMYGGHNSYPAPYPTGLPAPGKRLRELDDADDGYDGPEDGSLKRRRTVREDSAGQPRAILATKKR